MIGTSVSHYRILASIGAGGMGVVYLAEDERLHRTGHNIPRPDLIRESLDWLDTHLGAVR